MFCYVYKHTFMTARKCYFNDGCTSIMLPSFHVRARDSAPGCLTLNSTHFKPKANKPNKSTFTFNHINYTNYINHHILILSLTLFVSIDWKTYIKLNYIMYFFSLLFLLLWYVCVSRRLTFFSYFCFWSACVRFFHNERVWEREKRYPTLLSSLIHSLSY